MSALAGKSVLFVDDEEEWRSAVSATLTEAGYDVLPAADASEAMVLAETPSVGLIIVDEHLADESGTMLSKFLSYNHPGIPTLLYTNAAYDGDTAINLMNQGIDQCMAKGSMEELIVAVGSYLR